LAAASGVPDAPKRTLDELIPEEPSKSYSILLVEDHGDSAYVIGRLLSRHGHEVRTVTNVQAALEAFEDFVPDILISDLGLPDRSGLELMREVRDRFGDKVAAIALSGYGYEDDINKSMAAGFDKHVTKPVSFQRLENAIREIVG
jgi:CheY-like chemotaxis protein